MVNRFHYHFLNFFQILEGLVKTIFHFLSKCFLDKSGDPGKPRVLSLYINETIHSGLNIPCWGKSMRLSDKNCAKLSKKHLKVDFVKIYEILMVSSKLLY